jgi:hypothetical protein
MVTFAAKSKGYETSGAVGNATGFIAVWGGTNIFYGFNISNNSSQTISYDLTTLGNDSGNQGTVNWTAGSPSGSLSPETSVSVTFTVTSPDSDGHNNDACTMLQAGGAPLLNLGRTTTPISILD